MAEKKPKKKEETAKPVEIGTPGELLRNERGTVIGYIDAQGNPRMTGETLALEETAKKGLAVTEAETKRAEREQLLEATQAPTLLAEELQQKIQQPPSLAPQPAGELLAPVTQEIGSPIGITPGQFSQAQRLLSNPEEELKSVGLKVAAGSLIGVGLPYLTQLKASAIIPKAITGASGSVTALRTALVGILGFIGLQKTFDYKGDEMETYRTMLQKMVEDGERLEAANRNGYPSGDTIELLRTMNNEINAAEEALKKLGNYNLNYRWSKEYLADQTKVRSAREAILRRIFAVRNTALTGQAQFNPEELLFDISEFES